MSFFAVVCPLSSLLHQRRSTGLRTVLRGAAKTDVCQWCKEPAAELAGTAGYQVEEAADVTDHIYGRQYKDAAGRLGYHGQGAVSATVGAHQPQGPVRLFAVHRSL